MNKKIKIAHIVGGLHGGGVEAVIYNHFSHMDLSKFETHIISNSPSIKECEDDFRALGFHIHVLPERKKDFFGNLKQTINLFKKYKFDIIHVHMNLNCFYHTFLGKLCGIKIRIAHSHLVEYPKNPVKKFIDHIKKILTRITANKYFACGESAGIYLFGEKNIGKVFILNNAIDVNKFLYDAEKRKNLRNELNIPENAFCIGNIGRFTEQKNHTFIIDIFSEVHKKDKDALLLLFGKGELTDKIKEKVNKLGLTDNVLFMGVKNDIYNYYNIMDTFLFPSLYEGLGIVLIEAQTNKLMSFSADTVPKEVKLSDLVKFISLEKKPVYWAEKILEFKENGTKRTDLDTLKLVKESGYEINTSAKKLEREYEKYCK